MARNPSVSKDILENLSAHWSWKVREAVAQNPRTSRETLMRLASDPDQSVAKAAESSLS